MPGRRSARPLGNRIFIITTVAFQLILIATHLPNFIGICGLPPIVGTQAIALIDISNAFGTLGAGDLCKRWGNRNVLVGLIYLLRTTAIAVFFVVPVSAETTLIFAAAMGGLWLSMVPPISCLFRPANFGALFGVMFLRHAGRRLPGRARRLGQA